MDTNRPLRHHSRSNHCSALTICRTLLLVLLLLCHTDVTNANTRNHNNNSHINPYKTLGVSKNASQEEIKKSYRKLCLKFHPDKYHGTDETERKRYEETFKKIQSANSLIGNPESRRAYDSTSALHRFTNNPSSTTDAQHPFFGRQTYNPSSRGYFGQRRSFYVNNVDISHLFANRRYPFGSPGMGGGRNNPFFPDVVPPNGGDGPKSVFVETVTVPLQDLYDGVDRKELNLGNGFVKRYVAAFRGGIAGPIALNGLMASIPMLLRRRWPLPVLCFLAAFHFGLPRPTRYYYSAQIKKGWKGGTKLKFRDLLTGSDIVFVIREGPHPRYHRDGNDLHTTVTIGHTQARKGCEILLEPLGTNELPVLVKLEKKDGTTDGRVVTIQGRGWPLSSSALKKEGNAGVRKRGDLFVTVRVVSDDKADRIQKKALEKKKIKGTG